LDPTGPAVGYDPPGLPIPGGLGEPIRVYTWNPDGTNREIFVIPYGNFLPSNLIDGTLAVPLTDYDASVDGNAVLGYRTANVALADGLYTSLNAGVVSFSAARSILTAADPSPAIPEPTTLLLVLIGAACARAPRRRS
jgi:hypothetical protein